MARRRAPRRLPEAPDDAQVQAIIARAEASGPRDLAAVLLMAYAGLRVSEVAKLRWDDVEGGVIRVRMGKGRKDRLVPAHPRVAEALLALRKMSLLRSAYVFPSPQDPRRPITTRALQYLVERLGREAGVPRRLLHPHALRHWFATTALRRSGNLEAVRRLLGHSSIQTTTVYTHLVLDDLTGIVSRL
ncbi:Tyrosine recombinase XerC [bacterium HR24]|nr:Tyrosine recombinase XerC [bacterium HR24]